MSTCLPLLRVLQSWLLSRGRREYTPAPATVPGCSVSMAYCQAYVVELSHDGGDFCLEALGKGNAHQFPARLGTAAGGGGASGDADTILEEVEKIGNRFGAKLFDFDFDIHDIFEGDLGEVIAPGADPGQADALAFPFEGDGQAQGTEELGLDRFHPEEEAGEVDDAGHIGIGELDTAGGAKEDGHGEPLVRKVMKRVRRANGKGQALLEVGEPRKTRDCRVGCRPP